MKEHKLFRIVQLISSLCILGGLYLKNDIVLVISAIITVMCVVFDFAVLGKKNK